MAHRFAVQWRYAATDNGHRQPGRAQPGTYTDSNFRVVSSTQTITVPVTFTVGPISVSPQSLNFSYVANSSNFPSGQLITVNGQNLNYTVSQSTSSGGNWLSAVPSGNQINVAVSGFVLSGLTTGTYQGTVSITQSGAAPVNVPVTLTVTPQPPVTVSPTTVNLNYQIGGQNNQVGAVCDPGHHQHLGPAVFVWGTHRQSESRGTQLDCGEPRQRNHSPAGGSAQSLISYDTTAVLPAGTYTGTIPVAATGGRFRPEPSLLICSSPAIRCCLCPPHH